MKPISDEKNLVLPRREVVFEVNHSTKSTPDKNNIKEEVSKNLKCDKGLVAVKKISTSYGSTNSYAKVYVYDNKEDMKILERIKEEPKEEVPAESTPTEEKPAEELKEEKVEEKQDGEETKAKEQSTE